MNKLLLTLPAIAAALLLPAPRASQSQDTMNFPTLGKIHRFDPALDRLLARNARLEVIASGFDWTEGPVWDRKEGVLLFSDIPRNSIYRWKEGEGVSLFMKPSGYTGVVDYGREPGSNGLTFDLQGRLVCMEHGDRRISVLTAGGGKRTLTDQFEGKRLNSPNDGCFRSNGDLYFTDPPYGLPGNFEDPRRELPYCGVYRHTPDGKTMLLTSEMTRPNGIAFSPDEKTLYVAQSDSEAAIWMSYPVKADGSLGKGKVFFDVTKQMGKLPGAPDGLKVDVDGHLFATGPGGVYIFDPKARLLGRIETGERTSNCNWGGDGSTLYITADTYICRIKTRTRGHGWQSK